MLPSSSLSPNFSCITEPAPFWAMSSIAVTELAHDLFPGPDYSPLLFSEEVLSFFEEIPRALALIEKTISLLDANKEVIKVKKVVMNELKQKFP